MHINAHTILRHTSLVVHLHATGAGYLTNYSSQDRQVHEQSKKWEKFCIERVGIVPPRTTINPYIPRDAGKTAPIFDAAVIDPMVTATPIFYGT